MLQDTEILSVVKSYVLGRIDLASCKNRLSGHTAENPYLQNILKMLPWVENQTDVDILGSLTQTDFRYRIRKI